jgi:hypothetical protein
LSPSQHIFPIKHVRASPLAAEPIFGITVPYEVPFTDVLIDIFTTVTPSDAAPTSVLPGDLK